MAKLLRCKGCKTTALDTDRPPAVQHWQIRNATTTYDIPLCQPCAAPLLPLLAMATARPGGTVTGAETMRYLVRDQVETEPLAAPRRGQRKGGKQ